MLLGIFLYNGTMFYELKNGTLVETKDAQGNFDLTQVLGNKYLEDVDSEKCVIVDTYSNRCFLISKDLLHHNTHIRTQCAAHQDVFRDDSRKARRLNAYGPFAMLISRLCAIRLPCNIPSAE